ncbi:MAG: FmdB family zinc ribbon protein [Desulfobacterales bacterium]
MPMFEYNCKKCEYRFEKVVQRWDTETKCPLCEQPAEKLPSRFSVGSSQRLPSGVPAGLQPPRCTNC